MPTVTVLDYGFGNVRSAVRALEHVGADVTLTADRAAAENAGGLVVPLGGTENTGRLAAPHVTWSEAGESDDADRFVAAVENGPLVATQFHPEKSGEAGLQLLRNWVETL